MESTPFDKNNNKWLRICQEDVATIKNALAIISGYSQLLLKEPQLTAENKEKVQEIVDQTFRIAGLLREAKPEDCKKFLGGILKGLKEIREVLG